MSVRMRTLHIKKTKLPEAEETYNWREVFKDEIKKYSEVGSSLRGIRYREGLTQKQLAKKLGVSQHHISEMEHGKRTIGKKMAKKLSKILKTDYRMFL